MRNEINLLYKWKAAQKTDYKETRGENDQTYQL